MQFSHLRLGLQCGYLPSGFPIKTMPAPLLFPIRATYPAYLSRLDFINRFCYTYVYMILKNDVFADFLILCSYVQGRGHTKWIRFKIRSSLIKMSSLVSTVKQYGRLMGEECVFITYEYVDNKKTRVVTRNSNHIRTFADRVMKESKGNRSLARATRRIQKSGKAARQLERRSGEGYKNMAEKAVESRRVGRTFEVGQE